MNEITLVCSAHRETGLCNAVELLAILSAIGPDTVFEEVRPSDFALYCRNEMILEARSVAGFCAGRKLRRVPVDAYEVPAESLVSTKRALDSALDFVWESSAEYRELCEQHDRATHDSGFSYLNSASCVASMRRLFEIEDRTIALSNNAVLSSALENWRLLNSSREEAMVGHILEDCRLNSGDTGVFLVGVAHKAAIIEAIEIKKARGAFQVELEDQPLIVRPKFY
jgi:hypothetical protein